MVQHLRKLDTTLICTCWLTCITFLAVQDKDYAKIENEPTEEELNTQHKGKLCAFFELPLSGTPSSVQMGWIYDFYPEYGGETNFLQIFAVLSASARASENAVLEKYDYEEILELFRIYKEINLRIMNAPD